MEQVLFQHGMGGHSSGPALRRLGEALAAAGLACYMLDLQAHGYSESHGPPVQTVLDYNDMLSDMEALVQLATEQVPSPADMDCLYLFWLRLRLRRCLYL